MCRRDFIGFRIHPDSSPYHSGGVRRFGRRPVSEPRMNVGTVRWLLVTIFMLVAAAGCSPSPAPPHLPTSERTPASEPPLDSAALEAEIEKAITTGPATLDNVRAVLVNVDGESQIAHYRHGSTVEGFQVLGSDASWRAPVVGAGIADTAQPICGGL
jgi:hypothetical protein